ncbi:hypothetical protein Afil01_00430 [Actinorhabdospora filicis]|uniref:Uncharacterized protein n=1 Tax=Actinorhabdospora filicis TaxID=1785913 RepID=A0A9W6SIF7_9ACTN|nr:hypothetical protein [Actinorhabdospora filicis]GLZ75236.1 hypothetical protein Afil01_00430 [Actinorhabdospora filicis]
MPDPAAPRAVDPRVATWFPELMPSAREATRLHPRRARPGVHDSSIGRPALWPSWDEWPECPWSSHGFYRGTEYPIDAAAVVPARARALRPSGAAGRVVGLGELRGGPGGAARGTRRPLRARALRDHARRVLDLPGWTELDDEATGLSFNGGFYIFECRRCPDRPYTHYGDA